MKQLSKKEAIAFSENQISKDWTSEQIVRFQLFQDKLCMEFSVFHKAIEDVLGRPVFTHEICSESMILEYLGEKEPPTLQEIMDIIPEDKRINVFI